MPWRVVPGWAWQASVQEGVHGNIAIYMNSEVVIIARTLVTSQSCKRAIPPAVGPPVSTFKTYAILSQFVPSSIHIQGRVERTLVVSMWFPTSCTCCTSGGRSSPSSSSSPSPGERCGRAISNWCGRRRRRRRRGRRRRTGSNLGHRERVRGISIHAQLGHVDHQRFQFGALGSRKLLILFFRCRAAPDL